MSDSKRGVRRPDESRDTTILIVGSLAELNGDQSIAVVGGAQFESEVLEQLSFVNSDNHLSAMVLREDPDQARELSDMHFVHRLDRVIEYQAGHDRLDR